MRSVAPTLIALFLVVLYHESSATNHKNPTYFSVIPAEAGSQTIREAQHHLPKQEVRSAGGYSHGDSIHMLLPMGSVKRAPVFCSRIVTLSDWILRNLKWSSML